MSKPDALPVSENLDADRAARLSSGEAWNDFCDTLKAGGQVVLDHTENDERDRVEGFRFLTRMMLTATLRSVERRMPDSEKARIPVIPPPLIGGIGVQSPNQDHIVQPVDGRRTYKVTGHRGTAPYVHLSSWTPPPIPEEVGAVRTGDHAIEALKTFNPNSAVTPFTAMLDEFTDDDGSVEFFLSTDRMQGNWLPMERGTRELMGRVVYDDRQAQVAPDLWIECLDPEPGASGETPLPAEMSNRLAVTSQLILGMGFDYANWVAEIGEVENRLATTDETYRSIGGSPDDRVFEFGYWRIPSGQALVIEFDEPDCKHWNFQLCNHWMENLANYMTGQGYVSKDNAVVSDTGRIRIVVSPEDPGTDNWIDCGDRDHGVMGLRFVAPAVRPETKVTLVPLPDALNH